MGAHVVQMSSGVGSWWAWMLAADRYGPGNVTALFADVAPSEPSAPWEGEDPDNYRFLAEVVERFGIDLVTVSDGRGIWGLNRDQKMIANNRAPFCSRVLKHEPCRVWLEANRDPATTVLHVGIDLTEMHRCDPISSRWAPWKVDFPLMWKPYALKADAIAELERVGIEPPRMYAEGFPHANCAGFCSRMGNRQAEHLLRVRPDVYRWHEAQEDKFRAEHGDVAVLVDRRNLAPGEGRKPFPLSALRAEIEQRAAAQPSLFGDDDWGPCGCNWEKVRTAEATSSLATERIETQL